MNKRNLLIGVFLLLRMLVGYGQRLPIEIQAQGLMVDTAFFSVGAKRVNSNTFPSGTKLYLNLSGVHGLAVKDGKSFPGCSMKIVSPSNDVILQNDDLFSEYKEGVDSKDARQLNLNLTIGSPLLENQTYRWEARVWDKVTKSELTLSVRINVTTAKDVLGIKKAEQGLMCTNIYVLGSEPLTSNQVRDREKISIVFSGLKGFVVNKEKKVDIGASMILKDSNNNNVVEMTDLFKEEGSYDPVNVESLRLYLTIGDPMLEGNSYLWVSKILDKNSSKSIGASISLEVIK